MWDLTSVARFKLLDLETGEFLMNLIDAFASRAEPSAPSRLADYSSSVKRKMEAALDTPYVVESWHPKDVMILDDGKRKVALGTVTKVRIRSQF